MIEDFGEKIDGAAKDRWRGFLARIRMVPDDGIPSAPLAQSFPEPNYKALIREGVEPLVVAFVRATRERIPVKPKNNLGAWVATVAMSRAFCRDLIEDDELAASLVSGINGKGWNEIQPHLKMISGPMKLYMALGHEESLKGMDLVHSSYSFLGGVKHNPPISRWEVIHKKSKNARAILCHGESPEKAIETLREKIANMAAPTQEKRMAFSLYRRKSSGDTVIIGRKIGKATIDILSFPTLPEARAYLRDHHDDLVERVARLRQILNERGTENRERTGDSVRSGRDVTPEAFTEAFGFRGVQFGNYVEKARRQVDLNDAFDALHDLAGAIGCAPAALSLNGTLGLAFGARGSGGVNAAAAHYEPIQVVINLTKGQGAGSLAHEWFHALDNHLGRALRGPLTYATESRDPMPASLSPEEVQAASALREVAAVIRASGIPGRSNRLDRVRSTPYWGTMREMGARAFEAVVIDKLARKGITNDYLANILGEDVYEAEARLHGLPAGRYPYPVASEMDRLNAAFALLSVPHDPGQEKAAFREVPTPPERPATRADPRPAPDPASGPEPVTPQPVTSKPVILDPGAPDQEELDPFGDIQWS